MFPSNCQVCPPAPSGCVCGPKNVKCPLCKNKISVPTTRSTHPSTGDVDSWGYKAGYCCDFNILNPALWSSLQKQCIDQFNNRPVSCSHQIRYCPQCDDDKIGMFLHQGKKLYSCKSGHMFFLSQERQPAISSAINPPSAEEIRDYADLARRFGLTYYPGKPEVAQGHSPAVSADREQIQSAAKNPRVFEPSAAAASAVLPTTPLEQPGRDVMHVPLPEDFKHDRPTASPTHPTCGPPPSSQPVQIPLSHAAPPMNAASLSTASSVPGAASALAAPPPTVAGAMKASPPTQRRGAKSEEKCPVCCKVIVGQRRKISIPFLSQPDFMACDRCGTNYRRNRPHFSDPGMQKLKNWLIAQVEDSDVLKMPNDTCLARIQAQQNPAAASSALHTYAGRNGQPANSHSPQLPALSVAPALSGPMSSPTTLASPLSIATPPTIANAAVRSASPFAPVAPSSPNPPPGGPGSPFAPVALPSTNSPPVNMHPAAAVPLMLECAYCHNFFDENLMKLSKLGWKCARCLPMKLKCAYCRDFFDEKLMTPSKLGLACLLCLQKGVQ